MPTQTIALFCLSLEGLGTGGWVIGRSAFKMPGYSTLNSLDGWRGSGFGEKI